MMTSVAPVHVVVQAYSVQLVPVAAQTQIASSAAQSGLSLELGEKRKSPAGEALSVNLGRNLWHVMSKLLEPSSTQLIFQYLFHPCFQVSAEVRAVISLSPERSKVLLSTPLVMQQLSAAPVMAFVRTLYPQQDNALLVGDARQKAWSPSAAELASLQVI